MPHLVAKGLGAVVDDDGLGEVATQDGEVLHVVALHTHAMLSEKPESERKK